MKTSNSTVSGAGLPPLWRRLLVAVRPWSAPISTVPVFLGAGMAVMIGGAPWRWGRLALALVGSWAAHAAANIFSDVADHRRGLDRVPIPVSGAVVRGWLTEPQAIVLGSTCLALAALAGVWLATLAGPAPLWIAAAGLPLLLGYTWLKRIAAGDAAVFIAFGPLIAAGTWAAFTGVFSWLPIVWAAPFALIVIAVLHANNWRDIETDRACGVRTIAGLLGDAGSRRYYAALLFGAYLLMAGLLMLPRLRPAVAWPAMPWTFLLVFLTLPAAQRLWRRATAAPGAPERLTLDAATAAFMVPFGAASVAAILLAGWL